MIRLTVGFYRSGPGMCTLEATFPKFSPQALHPTPVSVASLSTMVNFHNPVVIEKDFCEYDPWYSSRT
jgi:hypothetical protein